MFQIPLTDEIMIPKGNAFKVFDMVYQYIRRNIPEAQCSDADAYTCASEIAFAFLRAESAILDELEGESKEMCSYLRTLMEDMSYVLYARYEIRNRNNSQNLITIIEEKKAEAKEQRETRPTEDNVRRYSAKYQIRASLRYETRDMPVHRAGRPPEEEITVSELIDILYRESSASVHGKSMFETEKELINEISDFYMLITIVFTGRRGSQFSPKIIPLREYYIIPRRLHSQLNLHIAAADNLYIKEGRNNQILYYLIKCINDSDENAVKVRDYKTIAGIWEQSGAKAVNNIIRPIEDIGKYSIFQFPGKPYSFNEQRDQWTLQEKQQIVSGIINSIMALHGAKNPYYIRCITLNNYMYCKTGNEIQPILINLETAKLQEETQQSAYFVENYMDNAKIRYFTAPELSRNLQTSAAKTDIYALGRLISYIYTGILYGDFQDLGTGYDNELQNLTDSMTAEEPAERPSIQYVQTTFNNLFKTSEVAALLSIGHRNTQEDAIFIRGIKLPEEDNFVCENQTINQPAVFAVFDGIASFGNGREASREAAVFSKSYFTADVLQNKNKTDALRDYISALENYTVQRAIQKEYSRYGTTAVIAIAEGNSITVANVGDSRAYLITETGMVQLTEDHIYPYSIDGKKKLYQHIGFSLRSRALIEPHISSYPIQAGNKLLICSDGLTGYVSDDEICDIILKSASIQEALVRLNEMVEQYDTEDNCSIILASL